jgi:hypothetical protein
VRRLLGWSCLGLLVLLLAWKLLAELIEPHYLLWFYPRFPYLEAPGAAGTALRLYTDTRPYVGKIARLQKGLVWVRRGRALVEEGYGFGCPIVVHEGRAYNSRTAQVDISDEGEFVRLTKRYSMDTVDTPIQFLRRKYRSVPALGVIECQYDVYPDGVIDVEVDLTGVDVPWQRLYVMNEQGARRFTRYYDDAGTRLEGEQIGIWASSGEFIPRACFENGDASLSFCVEPEPPALVYYGRERYNQYNWRGIFYLAWSGVDLEVSPPQARYRYRITLEAQ